MSDLETTPLIAYERTHRSTEPGSRTQNIRIAVIGGGPVGVVTLKTFLRSSNPESRIQATLFEA
jgi:cation diffusion facilitator CzcD-associated flavoprotein CzcO